MTKYNGQTITYDAIGNPLSYRDGISLTWQNGRELATFSQTNGANVSYTYDASGMRTSKTLTKDGATDTVKYVYENGQLLQMQYNHMYFDFIYDANGNPVSMAYRSTAASSPIYYYYGLNSRGDVIALYYNTGAIAARYSYDAYGKLLGVTTSSGSQFTAKYAPAVLNPLRYRGYVYDTETGLYYLQSRYYDPTTCRFVNADVYYDTGQGFNGLNMFAYCNNKPVVYSDPSGTKIFECCPYGCEYCRNNKIDDTSSNSVLGAGATSTTQKKHEDEMVLYPLSKVVTVKEGTSTTVTVSSCGDSSKPLSVYAQGRLDDVLLSSAGVKLNIHNSTVMLSLGLDNMGISYTRRTGDLGYSYGVVADFTQLKIGYENATIAWHDNVMVRGYTNYSITGEGLFMIYALISSGQNYFQYDSRPQPQPSVIGGR